MKILKKYGGLLIALLIIIFGLIVPFAAIAEETTTDNIVDLEPIVVTATRTDTTVTDAPGSISVISKKQIEERNIKSLDEALNTTVGVFDDSKGKGLMGTTSSVSMRGLSYDKRVLFMMDGIPLNDAYTGGVSYQLQSVENVEQIEVVKGAGSSLYGGNAMAGVVNIITRMPEKREITLKTGYGSSFDRGTALDDLSKVYISYGDRISDNFSFLGSYGYKTTNGYPTGLNVQSKDPSLSGISGGIPTTDSKGSTRYLIGDSGDNTWWDDQLIFKGSYEASATTKATISYMRSRFEYGYEDPNTYLQDEEGNPVWSYSTVKENSFLSGDGGRIQNLYSTNFETEFSNILARVTLGYLDMEENWYVTKGSTAETTLDGGPGKLSDTPSKSYTGDMQFTVPAGERHLVTVGTSYRAGEADNSEHDLSDWRDEDSMLDLTYEAGGKDRTYSAYIQDEVAILSNLTLYIGGREDWWEAYDGYANTIGSDDGKVYYDSKKESSFSPKAALVYKPLSATTFRSSIGKAFRAPTVYDLYRTWLSSTGTTYAANPDLTPETVISWEAGVEQGLWRGMKVSATYFHNDIEDMIYRKTVSSTLQENINAGEARTQGVELEAEQKFDFGCTLFANYTYTDSKMLENEAQPTSVGKELIQVPQNMFNAGVRYNHNPYAASLTCRYVGKRYGNDTNTDVVDGVYTSYDSYTTVDTKISYQVNKFAQLSLSLDNIFDREYFGYYPATGRAFYGELSLRF